MLAERPSRTCDSAEIVIVNPRAGAGAVGRYPDRWRSLLTEPYRIVAGESPEETEQLARQAVGSGARRMTIVGGDGTIHHALNGVLRARPCRVDNPAEHLPIRIIAAGTANDYAASLLAASQRASAATISVDVGQLTCGIFDQYFFNVAGIGLTARVAMRSHASRWLPARLRYTFGIVKTILSSWEQPAVTVQLDDRTPEKMSLLTLSLAIGQREGSFRLAPHACLDDGRFEVLLATGMRRRAVCRYLPGLMMGKLPENDQRVLVRSCRRMILETSHPLPFHLDGEIFSGLHDDVTAPITVRHAGSIQLDILAR